MATPISIHCESPRRTEECPGEVLLQRGLALDALPYLTEAALGEPEAWRHQVNLSIAYRKLGRYHESRSHLMKATDGGSVHWSVLHAWGQLLDEIGDFGNALLARGKAWDMHKNQNTASGLAWSLLRAGEWKEAWPLWEMGRFMSSWSPPPGVKVWTGEDISGKRLLIMAEGGYGDAFMFSRWFPVLSANGIKVSFFVWDAQIPILKASRSLKDIELLPMSKGINSGQFDYVTSLLSVPAMLDASADSIPDPIVFDFEQSEKGLGLCWRAEEFGTSRKIRSIPDKIAVNFLDGPGWVSLVPDEELGYLEPCPKDWVYTARLIASLAAVVTVDTAVAHLAGCLGKPTILMLPVHSSWAWGTKGNGPQWYDGMEIVRATEPDEWETVVNAVREKLNAQ